MLSVVIHIKPQHYYFKNTTGLRYMNYILASVQDTSLSVFISVAGKKIVDPKCGVLISTISLSCNNAAIFVCNQL